ncbi:MAG: M23 family metallopeptidase, partial [Marinilabiliales bacterium]|nr:M23 family metallopeptidase [Marinilabiliales bacterium]
MSAERKRDLLKKLLKDPYRIVIFNDLNLHIIKQIRFSARTMLLGLTGAIVTIIMAVTILIAFTPLREYIPGYPTGKMRQRLIDNALVTDSLEQRLSQYDRYIHDMKAMLSGESTRDTVIRRDSIVRPNLNAMKRMNQDSLFKDELEQEQFNVRLGQDGSRKSGIASLLFFPPLKGMISSRQDLTTGHYGVDVVAKLNSRISSALDGTVIFAEYTMDTGYVIMVQHEQNIITVYKHNAELLKKQGDKVRAGE